MTDDDDGWTCSLSWLCLMVTMAMRRTKFKLCLWGVGGCGEDAGVVVDISMEGR